MAKQNPGILQIHLSKDKRFMPMVRKVPRNPPAVGIFDEPTRCYRVNEKWASHIAGAVSVLAETQIWIGADDEQHSAIQSILQFLRGTVCDVINCDDVEDCLETSDTIDTIVIVSYSGQRNATADHFSDLNTLYDGTPQSIGSSIPTTAPNLDSLHDNALCYVLEQIVAVYAATKAAEISLKNGLQGWYQDLISAMRNIAPILPDWLFYLLGDELFGCVADFNAALVVLTDAAAKLDFACCLREELRTVAMSQANWDAAIATCVASLTGNAGDLACLFSGDNSLDHYLSFLEQYNTILVRQNDGDDFVCQCVPAGWFWQETDWLWKTTLHSGEELSPLFTHTNPANGELFAIAFRHRRISPPFDKAFGGVHPSGEIDSVVTAATGNQASGLMLWEEPILGVWEARDALGWPTAAARGADYDTGQRQANITWTIKFHDRVDLGHTRQSIISNVRLLYKEIP